MTMITPSGNLICSLLDRQIKKNKICLSKEAFFLWNETNIQSSKTTILEFF